MKLLLEGQEIRLLEISVQGVNWTLYGTLTPSKWDRRSSAAQSLERYIGRLKLEGIVTDDYYIKYLRTLLEGHSYAFVS